MITPSGKQSAVGSFYSSLGALTKSVESDKFAAFPSLHAAYAILFGYFATKLRKWLALISVPVTIGILFSTIYLGQHYVIDLIAGTAVAFSAILISYRYVKIDSSTDKKRAATTSQEKSKTMIEEP